MTEADAQEGPTAGALTYGVVGFAAVVLGLLVGFLFSLATGHFVLIVVAFGLVAGLFCIGVAIYRFDWFLYGLLALRPLLDGFNLGGQGSSRGALNPSVMIGMAFVLASLFWLVNRALARRLSPPSRISYAMAGLVLASATSCLVSASFAASAAATMRLAASALMFIVLEQAIVAGVVTVRGVLKAVFVAAGLVAAWSLTQLATGGGMLDQYNGLMRLTGPFVHPSVAAKFHLIVAMALIALLFWGREERTRRQLILLGLLVTVVEVLFSYTRAVWMTLLVGALYLLGKKNKTFVLPVVLAASVVVVSYPPLFDRVSELWNPPDIPGAPENSLAWRLQYWADLLPLALANPINGRGLDTILVLSSDGLAPHNVWIQTAVELGLVGLVALGSVVAAIWSTLFIAMRRIGDPIVSPLTPAAVAISACLASMMFSENLLNETTTLWYYAAMLTCAYVPVIRRVAGSAHAVGEEASAGRHRFPGTG